jgi:voltage-gated potassium channel
VRKAFCSGSGRVLPDSVLWCRFKGRIPLRSLVNLKNMGLRKFPRIRFFIHWFKINILYWAASAKEFVGLGESSREKGRASTGFRKFENKQQGSLSKTCEILAQFTFFAVDSFLSLTGSWNHDVLARRNLMVLTPPDFKQQNEQWRPWHKKLQEIIFEAETPVGKAFDVVLIISILLSVAAVMLDSVSAIREMHGTALYLVEWFFTLLFTVEYFLRLLCIGRPLKYAFSFFGMVDLLSIVPTYLSLLLPGTQYLLVIRILRILRIFRILKLVQYIYESRRIMAALRASRKKITVFLLAVLTLTTIFGSLMYMIEGDQAGFTSIPKSIYWTIVTLTTVGYGDISPQTGLGQILASVVMIMGYGIIAVPTGIVTVEMAQAFQKKVTTEACPECSAEGHDEDALFCKFCGSKL